MTEINLTELTSRSQHTIHEIRLGSMHCVQQQQPHQASPIYEYSVPNDCSQQQAHTQRRPNQLKKRKTCSRGR